MEFAGTTSSITTWFTKLRLPNASDFYGICRRLKVSPGYLLGDDHRAELADYAVSTLPPRDASIIVNVLGRPLLDADEVSVRVGGDVVKVWLEGTPEARAVVRRRLGVEEFEEIDEVSSGQAPKDQAAAVPSDEKPRRRARSPR